MTAIVHQALNVTIAWHPRWFSMAPIMAACAMIDLLEFLLNCECRQESSKHDGIYYHSSKTPFFRVDDLARFPYESAEFLDGALKGYSPLVRQSCLTARWLVHLHGIVKRNLSKLPRETIWRDSYLTMWREIRSDCDEFVFIHESQYLTDPYGLATFLLSKPIFGLCKKTHGQCAGSHEELAFWQNDKYFVRSRVGEADDLALAFDKFDQRFALLHNETLPITERIPQDFEPESANPGDGKAGSNRSESTEKWVAKIAEWLRIKHGLRKATKQDKKNVRTYLSRNRSRREFKEAEMMIEAELSKKK